MVMYEIKRKRSGGKKVTDAGNVRKMENSRARTGEEN